MAINEQTLVKMDNFFMNKLKTTLRELCDPTNPQEPHELVLLNHDR